MTSAPKDSRVRVGASTIRAGELRALRAAHRGGRLIPFLGAGVSLEYGVPAWRDLVVGLLFAESRDARLLRSFPPAFRRALATWLTDYVEYDLTILARVVKNAAHRNAVSRGRRAGPQAERAFLERLRAQLYPAKPARPKGPTTLGAVADFIAEGARHGRVPAVVTFNYDDLLERELTARGVEHHSVWAAGRARGRGIPVLHPHGFLPHRGAAPDTGVVFSEDEYHRVSGAVFHWAVEDVVHHLRHHEALFLGLSMSDPNLRRLLDASYAPGDPCSHWQVQKRKTIPRAAMFVAAQDIARRVAEAGDETEPLERMADALRVALKLAERFDRELHRSMGVRTLWLEDHGDIAPLLRAIRRR